VRALAGQNRESLSLVLLDEAAAIARATTPARYALNDADFGHLHAKATPLRDEQIAAIAFGKTDGI